MTMKMLWLTFIALPCSLGAAMGCMDKSLHGGRCTTDCGTCPRDYKTLYHIDCACDCDRYPQTEQFGRCIRCKHYRKPKEYS